MSKGLALFSVQPGRSIRGTMRSTLSPLTNLSLGESDFMLPLKESVGRFSEWNLPSQSQAMIARIGWP